MTTVLTATIKKQNMREDKTWNVLIRLTHDRKVRYLSTTMYVTKKDLTYNFKIKNMEIIRRCDDLIKNYRDKIYSLNLEVADMDIDKIAEFLKTKDNGEAFSFSDYAAKWIGKSKIKGAKNYQTAYNALVKFLGRSEITADDINVHTMRDFEESLSDRPRAQSLYVNAIAKMFNDMRSEYNDEDSGVIRIKHSLAKYTAPQQNVAEKRAITAEQVRAIYRLPYKGKQRNGQPKNRRDLARDCFILSFCLMGMNSADLYNATDFDGETIIYERTKTKDRRNDHARMEVRVHPVIRGLVEKYRGRDGHVFNFAARFANYQEFNRAVNRGLKRVGAEIGIDNLQFYSARHSMATIAVNEAGIGKHVVNDMLNHTDASMKVTELYIKKDFTPINEASFRLIDYVFGETE